MIQSMLRHLVFLVALALFHACDIPPRPDFPPGSDMFGLASPIRLEGDTTLVFLSDYFLSSSLPLIDSVDAHPSLRISLSRGRDSLLLMNTAPRNIPPVSTLTVWLEGKAYSLFLERSLRERFTFRFDPGEARYRQVSIRGEMNDWNPRRTPLHMIDGLWQTQLDLQPGRYQYLIVANGRDMLDPNNPVTMDNHMGGFNSVLEVSNVDRDLVPHLSPESFGRRSMTIRTEQPADEVLVLWQNVRLPEEYLIHRNGQVEIRLPSAARRKERSFIRIRGFNEHGPSNDLLIPLHLGQPLNDPSLLNRVMSNGEIFGSHKLTGSHVSNRQLDGPFAFNLYFDACSVFALDQESFHRLDYSLQQNFQYYGFNHLMGNITGNHDLLPFISLDGGALSFSEDEQGAGWEREVGLGGPSGYQKLSQLTAFIMTIPGVPVIDYGDEIGLPGAGDSDGRRSMQFTNLSPRQQWVRDRAAMLSALRASNLALVYGDFRTLHLADETYAYSRSYFGAHAVIVMNKSAESKKVSLNLPGTMSNTAFTAHFGSLYIHDENQLDVTLAPYGYEILTSTHR